MDQPAHTVAEFEVKYMMISNVKGWLSGVASELMFDAANVTDSRVIATSTLVPSLQVTLSVTFTKSGDFLDVENLLP